MAARRSQLGACARKGLLASAAPPAMGRKQSAETHLTGASWAPAVIQPSSSWDIPAKCSQSSHPFRSPVALGQQILVCFLPWEGWIALQSLPTLAGARRLAVDRVSLNSSLFPSLFARVFSLVQVKC